MNRAFLDLSGYTRDEVIGKPAMDILKTFDSKTVSDASCGVPSFNTCVCHDVGQRSQVSGEERTVFRRCLLWEEEVRLSGQAAPQTDSR